MSNGIMETIRRIASLKVVRPASARRVLIISKSRCHPGFLGIHVYDVVGHAV